MSWKTIKDSIRTDLLSRDLKNPNIRLNALERIEILLKKKSLILIENPESELRSIDKNDLKESLSLFKENGKISSAESSIINEIYRRI
jgi:ribosome-interacting GTPase 1